MTLEEKIERMKHGGFKSFIKRALELGLVVNYYENQSIFKFSYKKNIAYSFKNSIVTSFQSGSLSRNKEITKMILNDNNISVPLGIKAKNQKNAINLIKNNNLNYPLIVKPIDGSLALGLSRNINNLEDLKKAILFCKKVIKEKKLKSNEFIVEEMFFGKEHRVLVFKNKVLSCVEKKPVSLIGNGVLTIKDLIEIFNKKYNKNVIVDEEIINNLKKRKLNLNSILEEKEELFIRESLENGDELYLERIDIMNKDLKKICIKAVKLLNLKFAGVDLITKDITKDNNYVILEINSKPDYSINENSLFNDNNIDISKLLLEHLFPNLKNN